MYNSGEKNVYCVTPRKAPAVVTMPSRDRGRSPAVVITMPSRSEQKSNLVTLPAQKETHPPESRKDVRAMVRSGYGVLSLGVRMTLVALFALLGWPHTSRDNDPGPSAARPCHWEFTNLISQRRLSSGGRKSAAAKAMRLPIQEAGKKMYARVA